METIEILNKKWWYRLIKVIYIGLMAASFVISFLWVSSILNFKIMTDSSYERIERAINQESGSVNNVSDFKNGKSIDFERNILFGKYQDLAEYEDKYSTMEKILYHLAVIVGVILFFGLIKRVFFYIYLGTIFPKKK